MSEQQQAGEPKLFAELIVKLPFFVLGIATGMLVVWIAFQWVPAALFAALAMAN